MKVKNIFVKLLVSLLIVLTLANFIGSINNCSFADTDTDNQVDVSSQGDARVNEQLSDMVDDGGIIGAIINFVKTMILAPFRAVRSVNYALASSGGTQNGAKAGDITPFDIFFNRFTLLDVNIFSTQNKDGDDISDSFVGKIRITLSSWYYAIRYLAIAIAGIMFLWSLIRAISKGVSADQKVIAKNAIKDWLTSLALIMFMHFIIILVININELVLSWIEKASATVEASNFLDALENAVFAQNFILNVAALVVYAIMNWQTISYILVYLQRFLTIIFLVGIAPIVPITYSMDKMRGGSGVALNSWLKELMYNVFVQSLHALVYAIVVGTAMSQLTTISSVATVGALGPAFIAVGSMLFVKYAERMAKTIFGFNNSQIVNNNVLSNATTNVGNVVSAVGSTAARVATGGPIVSFGKNVDGSHIGIGQVVQGLGENAGRTIRNIPSTFKQTGSAFITGLRN